MIEIASVQGNLSSEMRDRLKCTWGGTTRVTRGRTHTLENLQGYMATDESTGRLSGVALYRVDAGSCELVVHESIFHRRGIGTRLLEMVLKTCDKDGVRRVWMVVNNDNVGAMRFYQKRGFNLCGFHPDSYRKVRESRPELPQYGCDGIAIRHELEFELELDGTGSWERYLMR